MDLYDTKKVEDCDSSETEGEDLISEMEELSKHENSCNGNSKDSENSVYCK